MKITLQEFGDCAIHFRRKLKDSDGPLNDVWRNPVKFTWMRYMNDSCSVTDDGEDESDETIKQKVSKWKIWRNGFLKK